MVWLTVVIGLGDGVDFYGGCLGGVGGGGVDGGVVRERGSGGDGFHKI